MRRLIVLTALLGLAAAVPNVVAKVGRQLGYFTPAPGGNGRGLEVRPGTSIGYYTFEGGGNAIYEVDMRTGRHVGQLNTDLRTVCRCAPTSDFGFGGLSWQRSAHRLWGSEYGLNTGWVDTINPSTGRVRRMFNARRIDARANNIEGLAVDGNGSVWLAGEEGFTVYHLDEHGRRLGSFRVPFAITGLAVDGPRVWLSDYPDEELRAYTKSGRRLSALTISVIDYIPYPLDISLDHCSFRGRKALWVYSAGDVGGMAAYQLGHSSSSGCRS